VVSADVLAGFAEVYRIARYATHTVDERMRDQARAALERVRAELAAPVAARGPAPTGSGGGPGTVPGPVDGGAVGP
jgi:hypothetical protein